MDIWMDIIIYICSHLRYSGNNKAIFAFHRPQWLYQSPHERLLGLTAPHER
jgi:hypothetical protein